MGGTSTFTIRNVTITAHGSADTVNDTYIYTNEFAEAQANDPSHRFINSDNDGGLDTINAAAVSSNSIIDLEGHFRIDGVERWWGGATTGGGNTATLIEDIVGGDGNDMLVGNAAGNHIEGWRGKDSIFGRGGTDVIEGGDGDDVLSGGYLTLAEANGHDGKDYLYGDKGNDFIHIHSGDDTVWGGVGIDTLAFANSGYDLTIDLSRGSANYVAGGSYQNGSGNWVQPFLARWYEIEVSPAERQRYPHRRCQRRNTLYGGANNASCWAPEVSTRSTATAAMTR